VTILVTGATGNVGRAVVDLLLARDVPVRALSRNPRSLPAEVDVQSADLTDPSSLGDVLTGVDKVYLYAHPSGVDGFVAAAQDAGVRHVVLLSALAAGDTDPRNAIAQMHLGVEGAVERSGLAWTFVRPGAFAANALHWAASIKDSGGVRIPYAQAQNSSIHELDIAEVSVAALLEDGHEGETYVLTGPESLTQERQVALISAAIGKPLWVEDLTGDDAHAVLTRAFRSPDLVDTRIRYYEQTLSQPDLVSDTTAKLLGRPGRTFAQWADDHRADFS